jgi:hypothetical protein
MLSADCLRGYFSGGHFLAAGFQRKTKMRNIKYNFLFVIALILGLGLSNVFAEGKDDRSRAPKNTGILTVKTTPGAYAVRVDGQVVGMSGVDTPAEFYLTPGTHRVEVEGPNGQMFSKEIEIRRGAKIASV